MDEAEHVDFIGSVCNNFADSINASSALRLRGQDGYEVLSLVFGETFTPAALHAATSEHLRDLAMAVWELLEARVSPEAISLALQSAVQTSGYGPEAGAQQ